MTMFRLNGVPANIRALPILQSASGSVATFDTDMTENLIEVVCDIQYQQASGTPTPSDPLPITVYNSLNLSHSGADTSNPTVYNIPFGQTVAKGTLNVITGVLEITHGVVDMGSYTWTLQNTNTDANRWRANVGLSLASQNTYNNVGSFYSGGWLQGQNTTATSTTTNVIDIRSNVVYLNIRKDLFDGSESDFNTFAQGNSIVYELATPQVIQLSATQITALLNENNIWCDTGDTEVKYWMSIKKYIGQ